MPAEEVSPCFLTPNRWKLGQCLHSAMVVRTGVSRAWCLLGLTLFLTSAEDFSWTRQRPGSFYYSTFPKGFLWGVGSSACQTEGAWDKGGKGPSIWDAFGHQGGNVFMNHTADSACESYHKVKVCHRFPPKEQGEVMEVVKDFMFLGSQSTADGDCSHEIKRQLLLGRKAMAVFMATEKVNREGLGFYNDTINALLANKIIPIVTLYYWDLPQALQQKYGGWQNISMTRYFKEYADLCFESFGDRVKHWITFNNPWAIAEEGYETGRHAPGQQLGSGGAYKAAHHIIKAHAEVWHSYQKKWRRQQQGLVGISLHSAWGEPIDLSSKTDVEVAERYMQFSLGWFANPLYHGDYPGVMKEYVGKKSTEQGMPSRLPAFSVQEKNYIKGTVDFLGIGHFTTYYISRKSYAPPGLSYVTDRNLVELVDPKWPESGSKWLYSVPWGFRRLLNFVKVQYGNPLIYVTENGISEKLPCAQLCDDWRIDYLRGYINEMLKAIKDGVNVQGYTAWSLLDKFEWDRGYSERFGLYYVDFQNQNKPRYPKASVHYYKKIIKANGFPNAKEVASWHHQATDICSSSSQLLVTEPLATHMEMVTEIVVPTVFTLCILISAILLLLLLRKRQ